MFLCKTIIFKRMALVCWTLAFVLYGLSSARMVQLTMPSDCNQPGQLLEIPSVKRPTLDGLFSGLSLGAYPKVGYGEPTACLDVDAGRGVAPAQWPLMVRATAKTWAYSRGIGFAVSSWVLWWALGWLWRGARLLPWWTTIKRKLFSLMSRT
jgi:hypothetical protein